MNKKFYIFSFLTLLLLGLWFCPHPSSFDDKSWHLFAIFTTTIIGIILEPIPIGAIALLGMCLLIGTNTLSLEQGLSGFHNSIVWLIFTSFSIARAIIKTGLGERIAYFFVKILGKNSLGLSYGLLATDCLLAPAIPSVTARSGGIVFPVLSSLSESFGSSHKKGTEKLLGAFLTTVAYQGSAITSAMFLTAMAGNPLIAAFSQNLGYPISWGKWALAAIVPGILSLIFLPYLIYKIYPPKIKTCPEAPLLAKEKLKNMGPLKKEEKITLGIFFVLVSLWSVGSFFNFNATTAALIGLSLLLIFNIIEWKDIANNSSAWETFIWFSVLVMMASYLNELGFIPKLGEIAVGLVGNFSWLVAFPMLFLIYFYTHYFFAGNTAHIGAMFPVFLTVSISLGTPPMLAILSLSFASNLFGGLTHYGSGPAPLFYGSGFVPIKEWLSIGFITSLFNILIWIGLGSLWWYILGWL